MHAQGDSAIHWPTHLMVATSMLLIIIFGIFDETVSRLHRRYAGVELGLLSVADESIKRWFMSHVLDWNRFEHKKFVDL